MATDPTRALQLPLLAWTLASAGCQLLWSHGLFARQDLLGGLVLGSACTYALWRLVTLLQQVRCRGSHVL